MNLFRMGLAYIQARRAMAIRSRRKLEERQLRLLRAPLPVRPGAFALLPPPLSGGDEGMGQTGADLGAARDAALDGQGDDDVPFR